jgi:hypothetical protein
VYLPVPKAGVSPVPWHGDIANLSVRVSVPGDAEVHDSLHVEEREEELGGHPGVELQGAVRHSHNMCIRSDHILRWIHPYMYDREYVLI